MHPTAEAWLDSHTWRAHDWRAEEVSALLRRQGMRVAVVLPALNEEATIGGIVADICSDLVDGLGLVDDVLVVDSGSSDATAATAVSAGARVVRRDEVLADVPVLPGKGEAMWRGLAATDADIVVFIDADLQSFTSDYVVGLVGPLAADPQLQLVKAVYERPLVAAENVIPAGGGRVTELMARPLLNRFWPELAAVVQPLAGEYAARRDLLISLSFPTGYGVEMALLVDTYVRHGLGAIGQVDLGVRVHRHHDDRKLGLMAAEVLEAAAQRVATTAPEDHASITQFERTRAGYVPRTRTVAAAERPPLRDLPRG